MDREKAVKAVKDLSAAPAAVRQTVSFCVKGKVHDGKRREASAALK